ncbi:hypothetical protein [uncultured Winogradskyella sp.]|uniref:arsenate reductase family protein n=1 Tax=uncultured Winogradskyella sp. TaxID=395353 RepID=UPI00260E9611|nr:hypothetical protein [uncultured Winogradskyella sp.]
MAITLTNTDDNLINCIYRGGTQFGDQLEAFLKASDKDILPIDITKTMPTDTQWHDIAKQLNVSLKSFINTDKVKDFNEHTQYSEEGLVKILANNPNAFKGAVIMEGDRIAHITKYTDLLRFYDVDSAGLEKTLHTEKPIIKSKTGDDNYIN